MILMINLSDDIAKEINENRGNRTATKYVENIIWQAVRDPSILTRARDMVSQPREEYDNLGYE
jgi:hypothetical protein